MRRSDVPEIHSQVTVGGSLGAVAVTDQWAYVAAGEAGLQVLKISH